MRLSQKGVARAPCAACNHGYIRRRIACCILVDLHPRLHQKAIELQLGIGLFNCNSIEGMSFGVVNPVAQGPEFKEGCKSVWGSLGIG